MQCLNCNSVTFRKVAGDSVWACSRCGTAEGTTQTHAGLAVAKAPDIAVFSHLTYRDCVAAESKKIEDRCNIPRGEFGGRDFALDGRRL